MQAPGSHSDDMMQGEQGVSWASEAKKRDWWATLQPSSRFLGWRDGKNSFTIPTTRDWDLRCECRVPPVCAVCGVKGLCRCLRVGGKGTAALRTGF